MWPAETTTATNLWKTVKYHNVFVAHKFLHHFNTLQQLMHIGSLY
jgi:hypothetical protein